MQIFANFYQAGSDSCQLVTLYLQPQGIVIHSPAFDGARLYTYAEFNLSAKLANLPTQIVIPDLGTIEFRNEAEFEQRLRSYHHPNKPWLHWFERSPSFWLVCVLMVPLLFYAYVEHLVPAVAKSLVSVLPYSVSQHVEDQTLQIMQEHFVTDSNLTTEQKTQLLHQFEQLLAKLQLSHDKYRLLFNKSDLYGANAFALPGGAVVITDDLYQMFVDNPEVINAIFLHEIAHVEYQHGLQGIAETITTSLMLNYFLGDLQGMAELLSASSITLLQNNFSRTLESEADDYALAKMAELGLSVEDFIVVMTELEQAAGAEPDMLKYFSTHPHFKERIEKAKKAIDRQ
ncbi:M48 family metallopeptidase [Thalassotalea ponticola]|uniref:M48 family metallopeptidase n=1 Tax=Thalassotalea ponticola TaxID=1523392 RepID=UPI0025B520B3|nr:M48 family metallopeptidase [Thalassotalea ponticola]MDN3653328.1 M48 family metallopeptidase [Thalassotalea ponticola]